MSHIAWTKDVDEHLLHLRDVAQLNWQTLVSYFPSTTPHSVRERYQQLKKSAAADQATHNHRSPQSCKEKRDSLAFEFTLPESGSPNGKDLYHTVGDSGKEGGFCTTLPRTSSTTSRTTRQSRTSRAFNAISSSGHTRADFPLRSDHSTPIQKSAQ